MARNFNDLKESLYIHENQEARTRMMCNRWWVAPELNYVLPPPGSTRDVDFERRPKFTPKIETYAVGRIAHWIYDGNLSLEYFNKQHKVDRGDDPFTFSTTDQTFKCSLEQLFMDDLEQRATLNRMWLAREPGAGSGERGAGIKRAGSRDCCKKSRNR
jgi:hypothetical protein